VVKILWLSDGGVPTGFGTVAHAILGELVARGHEVHHLAFTFSGDPHPHPWTMYPAGFMSNIYGHDRLPKLLPKIKPDVVVILNDPWVVMTYRDLLKDQKVVAYLPVDGENQWAGKNLNWLRHAIAYTSYGARELRKGGYVQPISVAPHGIDLQQWYPTPRDEARKAFGFSDELQDAFIVGNVNRNQRRKRFDLTMLAFRAFVQRVQPKDAKLLLHCALQDQGWDLIDLAGYLGIDQHMIFTGVKNIKNYDEMMKPARMRLLYASLDLQVSTSVGEGWGLTNMEGMACGAMQALPSHSAFDEWAAGGAELYSAPTTVVHDEGLNTVHHAPSVHDLARVMEERYHTRHATKRTQAGLALVKRPEFRWANVGKTFDRILKEVANEA
jgi:D-inositol-3-phosphate glycosyltransferase